ncbi:MAG: ATP-binding protein [Spirochaetales bacterium]|nr:ATP-binding protein [Spirochaetales bacterium]
MYEGNLADSLQLGLTLNCFTLLLVITVLYLIYYIQTKDKLFKAGALLSLNSMLFVLAENIIIICGWLDLITFGRYVSRTEQTVILLILASLSYFLLNIFPYKKPSRIFFKVLIWIALFLTLGFTAVAFIKPELFVSVTRSTILPMVSPEDFARGGEGPLFRIRDYILLSYIFIFLISLIVIFIRQRRRWQTGLYIIGIIFAVLGAFDDIQYLYTNINYFMNDYRFSRFVLGVTIMLLFFLPAVLYKVFSANVLLGKTKKELKSFENRYSVIVEATDEIIFSLSEELTIVSANQKAERLFKLNDGPVNFVDCFYMQEIDEETDFQYFKERLLKLKNNGDKLSFNTYIKDWVTLEPVEYHFRFDCILNGDKLELAGRAWPAAASKLLEYVNTERLTLKVENYIAMVGDIVDRLTDNIHRCLDESDVMLIKMGLNEMIVNAMEHGNLNVSFDEKTKAQEEGRLFDFMGERRKLPEYRDKKVTIDYFFNDEKVIYRITDMGNGFDYNKMMNRIHDEVNQLELMHGRGILMTQAVFDSVEYNNKGNQVLLVKNFRKDVK